MPNASQPDRRRGGAHRVLVAAAALVLAACSAEQGVESVSAIPTGSNDLVDGPAGAIPTPGTVDTVAPPPPSTAPPTTIAELMLLGEVPIADVVDTGGTKPPRDHDAFVGVAVADIERWWAEQFPAVYGSAWEPLAGGIFAGYPERDTDIPGCGEPTTSYRDLNQFAAFYCSIGDFMVYDDGPDSLLTQLSDSFGASVMGVVISHEYGHAVQERIGALDEFIATIFTEQQADCFSGAWVGQAYRGESPLLRLGDNDVRTGLIAMLEVRDPVGTNQFVDGGHGSAFDRVGAFQEGFQFGAGRCAELLDAPLTLMPNEFQPATLDELLGGNAPYDCEELRDLGATDEDVAACTPAPEFLADDLNDFWNVYVGDGFPDLVSAPVADLAVVACADPIPLASEVLLCPSQDTVAFDEPDVIDLYREFGDFTLGYFYGIAWAERAQQHEGSPLTGEARALLNDCYTGAWTGDITPDPQGNTPRQRDTDGDDIPDTGISSSPGDLDEAIRMAILVGDAGADVNVVGSPFEKIAAFRVGVLGGLDACRTQYGA